MDDRVVRVIEGHGADIHGVVKKALLGDKEGATSSLGDEEVASNLLLR